MLQTLQQSGKNYYPIITTYSVSLDPISEVFSLGIEEFTESLWEL